MKQKAARRNAELSRRHRLWNKFSVMWSKVCLSQSMRCTWVNEYIYSFLSKVLAEKKKKYNKIKWNDLIQREQVWFAATKTANNSYCRIWLTFFLRFVRSSALKFPSQRKQLVNDSSHFRKKKSENKSSKQMIYQFQRQNNWIRKSISGSKICLLFFFFCQTNSQQILFVWAKQKKNYRWKKQSKYV